MSKGGKTQGREGNSSPRRELGFDGGSSGRKMPEIRAVVGLEIRKELRGCAGQQKSCEEERQPENDQ